MNREITFRAWDGERLRTVNTIGWMDGELDWIDTPKYHGPIDEDVELMQYIGIKDTNGNKIYERDIVEDEQGRRNLVRFKEGLFLIGNWNAHGFMNAFTEFRVIGNVFENPEMLKED